MGTHLTKTLKNPRWQRGRRPPICVFPACTLQSLPRPANYLAFIKTS